MQRSILIIIPVLAACLVPPAAAQDRALVVGRESSARLGSPGDPVRSGRPFQVWSLRVESSMTIQVDMRSRAFDTYLVLQDGDGLFLFANDNGEQGTDARLVRDVEGGRTYRIIARSSTDSVGDYTLAVTRKEATEEGIVGTVARGDSVNSTLSQDAPKVDGRPYRAWYVQGNAGDSIVVDVISDAFDSFLIIQDAVGRNLAQNDDWNGALHSHLVFRFPGTGRYRILATVFDRSASGPFLLKVR